LWQQVYVIGTGSNNQFLSNPRTELSTAHFTVEGFQRVVQAWRRVGVCL
jgi:hypothetical protein